MPSIYTNVAIAFKSKIYITKNYSYYVSWYKPYNTIIYVNGLFSSHWIFDLMSEGSVTPTPSILIWPSWHMCHWLKDWYLSLMMIGCNRLRDRCSNEICPLAIAQRFLPKYIMLSSIKQQNYPNRLSFWAKFVWAKVHWQVSLVQRALIRCK